MTDSNSQPVFSIEALRLLMSKSPAYADLSAEQKKTIEKHIINNDKPVLLYIFQQLSEESQALQQSRENLANKVLKTDSIDPKLFQDF